MTFSTWTNYMIWAWLRIKIVEFAKLISLHHSDKSAILWWRSSSVFHVRLVSLGGLQGLWNGHTWPNLTWVWPLLYWLFPEGPRAIPFSWVKIDFDELGWTWVTPLPSWPPDSDWSKSTSDELRWTKGGRHGQGGLGLFITTVDLLFKMIYDLKRSVDLRWVFGTGNSFILDDLV